MIVKVYTRPNWKTSEPYEGYRRCDACGNWNKIGRTPEGGEFYPTTRDDPETGYTWGDLIFAGNGCWHCGSPAWRNGGKLGDLSRVK